jgi:hypothetical protein
MGGYFGYQQSVDFLTADLANDARRESRAVTRAYHHFASQIGQNESGCSIPAIRSAQQRKQRLILIDRQSLPAAG